MNSDKLLALHHAGVCMTEAQTSHHGLMVGPAILEMMEENRKLAISREALLQEISCKLEEMKTQGWLPAGRNFNNGIKAALRVIQDVREAPEMGTKDFESPGADQLLGLTRQGKDLIVEANRILDELDTLTKSKKVMEQGCHTCGQWKKRISDPKPWVSHAEWDPKHGFQGNQTFERHTTREEAEEAITKLNSRGLNEERCHFPERTWISEEHRECVKCKHSISPITCTPPGGLCKNYEKWDPKV